MRFGIDRLLGDPALRQPLAGRRIALVAHPASVTDNLTHSLDALIAAGIDVTAALGPQHGLKGDKQDNMVETGDERDPTYDIPVYSLYGEVRRPSAAMMDSADVFLFDLQDLGCRIYTFVTTLLYLLEEAARRGKTVWVLDRPNPAGRPVEGSPLVAGQESFVGAAPMPMRHGLTMGEMGHWFIRHFGLDVDYRVIAMDGWSPGEQPGFGWPEDRVWINPSPNAAGLNMARCYAGTVMLEGTTLSEGRGTTRPLEILFGAPDLEARAVLAQMERLAPQWLVGCAIRECWFTPTFHKHSGALCSALMVHAEGRFYDHAASGHGGCRRSLSRRSACSSPIIHYGATSPMNTSSSGWQSMSSMAGRRCASGWTTHPPYRPTSRHWPRATRPHGARKWPTCFCTEPVAPIRPGSRRRPA